MIQGYFRTYITTRIERVNSNKKTEEIIFSLEQFSLYVFSLRRCCIKSQTPSTAWSKQAVIIFAVSKHLIEKYCFKVNNILTSTFQEIINL